MALVREAGAVDRLAAPEWKRDEPGLLQAADMLGLPLMFVGRAELSAVQGRCVTHSPAAARATGLASVAEAAALAGGGTLLRPRSGQGWATCALAYSPPPLLGGVAAARFCEDNPASAQHRMCGTPPPGPLPQGEGGQTT